MVGKPFADIPSFINVVALVPANEAHILLICSPLILLLTNVAKSRDNDGRNNLHDKDHDDPVERVVKDETRVEVVLVWTFYLRFLADFRIGIVIGVPLIINELPSDTAIGLPGVVDLVDPACREAVAEVREVLGEVSVRKEPKLVLNDQ